jgi:hypothetical protein
MKQPQQRQTAAARSSGRRPPSLARSASAPELTAEPGERDAVAKAGRMGDNHVRDTRQASSASRQRPGVENRSILRQSLRVKGQDFRRQSARDSIVTFSGLWFWTTFQNVGQNPLDGVSSGPEYLGSL